jgi:hypothetical protein
MKFDLELHGKEEFVSNNKYYYVLKIDTIEKEKFMINIFNEFIINQNNNINEKHYIGIDFEFNQVSKGLRDVALMQINLENDMNKGYIFVLNPTKLKSLEILLKLITHKRMIKILHGAESLDIPYLFNQLLITKDNIDNFCSNFYDTKFLCDYNNLIKYNDIQKCGIYHLLVNNNIISKKQYEKLEKIEEKTGPIYMIHIDIYKLSIGVLQYSLYDVLYLPELIKKFLKLDIAYTKIIPQVSCIVNKYKRNIENEFNVLSNIINSFNICYVIENNMKILLKDIWEMYYYSFSDKDNYFSKMKEIHYFKFFFEIISKFIIYCNIIRYFKVYRSNNNIIIIKNNNIYSKNIILLENIESYFNWLYHYNDVDMIFSQINKLIKDDMEKILPTFK